MTIESKGLVRSGGDMRSRLDRVKPVKPSQSQSNHFDEVKLGSKPTFPSHGQKIAQRNGLRNLVPDVYAFRSFEDPPINPKIQPNKA